MRPQPINVVGPDISVLLRTAGGSFPRRSQYNVFFPVTMHVRADESKIDDFVIVHMQDVARERIPGGRIKR